MVSLRTTRRQAVEMGQTSSQVGPSTLLDPAEELDARLPKKKYGKRKGKRRSAEVVEEEDDEEGTARALMQLSADAVLNARQTPYDDDDLAASAQLMAESSTIRPFKIREAKGHMKDREDRARKKKTKSKKRRLARSQLSSNNANEPDIVEGRSRNSRHIYNGLGHPGMSPSDIPRSTFSLDDIDSNDEVVASYLHEYENGIASHPSPSTSPTDSMRYQYPEQMAALETASGPTDNATYSKSGAPSPPYAQKVNGRENRKRKSRTNLPTRYSKDENQAASRDISQLSPDVRDSSVRAEEHKSKRKKTMNSTLDNGYDEHQGLLNGTGQHAFDHDFAALDQYLAENGMHSANLFDPDPGHIMPIDPQLIREDKLLERAEHDRPPTDDVALQTSGTGKLKRVPPRSGKPRTLVAPRNKGSSPSYVSPYASNKDRHNRISSNTEDQQSQPSPELGLSGSVGANCISHSSPAEKSRPKKSTSKPEKRSKSLGTSTGRQERGRSNYNPPMQEIVDKGGMFTTAEVTKLDNFRDGYCEENEINTWQFNELIHTRIRGNPKVTRLFDDIQEVLPYRKRASVQRCCRRRYHNFSARGTWTKEEDERLKQAIAEKGKSWITVGEMVERMPEDCRDRWRNYLINSDNRNTEKWTDAEIKNLIMAVHDCIRVMRQTHREEKEKKYAGRDLPDSEYDTDEEVEEMKLINWQAVSDRMGENGGGRSRLQCSHKYGKLKLAGRRAYMKDIREARESMRRLVEGHPQKKSSTSSDGWRYKKAEKRVANMKTGDKYDFLQLLSTCNVQEEGNIPWKHLGDDDFQAKWSRLDRIAAWETIKKDVPGSDKMDYHDVVNRVLTRMMAEDFEHLDERWNPEVDGDANEEGNFKKLTRKQERRNETRRKERASTREGLAGAADPYGLQEPEKSGKSAKLKSAQFVTQSDEGDLDVDDNSQQDSGDVKSGDKHGIRNSRQNPTASSTENERQGQREGDISEDAEQPGSDEEEQVDYMEDSEESRLGDGNVSDELGHRMQVLRDALTG